MRAVLDRELQPHPRDLGLLRLERMRTLDLANAWAPSTLRQYGSKLAYLRRFQAHFPGVHILPPPELSEPPRGPAIPLAWAALAYSLRPSPTPGRDTVSFGATRQLRSAVGWHSTVLALICTPQDYTVDKDGQQWPTTGAPHQTMVLTQFTKGMEGRIGTDAAPSWALRDRHIRYFDRHFDMQYRAAGSRQARHHWAQAGLANLLLWLGWLRSRELWDLRLCDVDVIQPSAGPTQDLPPGVGAILLRLSEETKTHRTSTADVPIAFHTLSGLRPGRWWARLLSNRDAPLRDTDVTPVFLTPGGGTWDSYFYRHQFVYPLLRQLQLEGDPVLVPLTGHTPGDTIPDKFRSLHMYRRGANSHVEVVRDRSTGRRTATAAEQYEHGRWSKKRAAEPMHVMYRTWTLWDRLQITLCCM